jgi:hypothetical protein
MANRNYGPKTGAGSDHPYTGSGEDEARVPTPAGKDPATPPDANTETDSEADLGDPLAR